MGWSCSSEASKTLQLVIAACSAATEQTNVFHENGETFFFEVDTIEHADGRITGNVQKMVGKDECVPWAPWALFLIEATGRVSRGPRFFMSAAPWCHLHNQRWLCAQCAAVVSR